ncbi:MAG TPA: twin-arginine translocation signal domain-containing protein [Acidimicrobiales bacterium]|nr:twin-arginine translocation signal domain-containing protein [Acidimicrobiales bacterium]
MTDHDDQDSDARAQTRRKFLAGAGLAAGAAGAATLLGASPASASTPATGEFDLDLKWADITGVPWVLDDVDLGDGGFAKGVFSAFGDMAALSIRILVGEDADPGDGPWVLEASSMPSGYTPATPPNDLSPTGTPGWGGVGNVVDFTKMSDNNHELLVSWNNFTSIGNGTLLTWTIPNVHNDASGSVLFNYGGSAPYPSPLGASSQVVGILVYLREPEEP